MSYKSESSLIFFFDLPVISEEQNPTLTAAITENKLNSAISRLKANKSPSLDGFPSEWYKKSRPEFILILLLACDTSLTEAKMPL